MAPSVWPSLDLGLCATILPADTMVEMTCMPPWVEPCAPAAAAGGVEAESVLQNLLLLVVLGCDLAVTLAQAVVCSTLCSTGPTGAACLE